TVGTTFDNQALTITPRGQAFPPAVNVSPDAYYYNDQRWSANTRGDVGFAYAYGDPNDDTESTTVYGVGTRAAGSGVARRFELDRQVTGKAENSRATHTVAIDVGVNG